MDEATLNNFLLLQRQPFEEIYGIVLTKDFFHRASAPERMLALHYLFSILDPKRCAIEFAESIVFSVAQKDPKTAFGERGNSVTQFSRPKSEMEERGAASVLAQERTFSFVQRSIFEIRNMPLFRRTLYEIASELQPMMGYELPSSAEFCNSNSRNLKMLYCFSKYLVRMRSQELIEELEDVSPFKILHNQSSAQNITGINDLLCDEVAKSAIEWKRIRETAAVINKLAREAETLRLDKIEAVEPELETQEGLSKLEQYLEKIKTVDEDGESCQPNMQEMLYLQGGGEEVFLDRVLWALNPCVAKTAESIGTESLADHNELYDDNMTELCEIRREVSEAVEVLQKKFETAKLRFIEDEEKKKVHALELQHYSQIEQNVDILDDINLSQLSTRGPDQINVLEHSVIDENSVIKRSAINVLETRDLSLDKPTRTPCLAQKIRQAHGFEQCETVNLVGGNNEGVREYLRIQ